MSALLPRQITWNTIEKSRNQAVLPLLAAGTASTSDDIRLQCIKSLLSRPEPISRKYVILAWEKLSETDIDMIRSNLLHFHGVASDMLATGSLEEQRCALMAITNLLLAGSLPAVLKLVLDPQHALQPQANDCLQRLCSHWGNRARADRDVPSIRGPMLDSLYASLCSYPHHQSIQVVDAWLALVHWDDSLQRGLMADPDHRAFQVVFERLKSTHDAQLITLLAGYLLRSTTPKSIQKLICEKADPQLALELATMVDTHHWINLKRRLRELPPLECLQSVETRFHDNCRDAKERLWLLLSVSSRNYGQVLHGAVQIAKLGNAEGRKIAAQMVMNCRKPAFDVMVGDLQSAMEGIARPNSAGYALLEIVRWAQSASLPQQRAAQELFGDFTVERLIEQVVHWPTSMCKAIAYVICFTTADFISYLVKQLESPAPKRRLAALRATQMLGHSEAVSQYLLPMLDDTRLDVRVRVIDLLSELDSEVLDRLIPVWLSDVSTDIQEAAARVLRRRARMKKTKPSGELSHTRGLR